MIRTCEAGHPPVRLASRTRCPACERRRDAARPSRNARGYDAQHYAARAALAAQIYGAGGTVPCGYGCGTRVSADTMVAAHLVDGRPEMGWIAACRSCNERAKGGGSPGRASAGAAPAPWQSDVRPGFRVFPAAGGDRADVGPRAPQGAHVAR